MYKLTKQNLRIQKTNRKFDSWARIEKQKTHHKSEETHKQSDPLASDSGSVFSACEDTKGRK